MTEPDALRRLMRARSVAVVGASERPGAPTGFVIRNLEALGWTGAIHPVHPMADTLFGRKVAPSLDALAEPVDAVVIGIAAERVADEMEAAARLGISGAVILASGFAELDEAGEANQQRITAAAADMAVCGPNCLGFVDLARGFALYSSRIAPSMKRGGFSIVSHSGAGAITLGNLDRLGIATLVSVGNGAVTDAPDYLRYLAEDEPTRAVGLVLESIRDPAGFAEAMAAMHRAGKPVLALQVGRSTKGAAASRAHTGALAADSAVTSAFLRQVGVVEVADYDQFVETAVLMTYTRRPAAGSVAAVGVSGGGLAHFCDMAAEAGVALAALSPAAQATLREFLPAYATIANPLDVTGTAFARPDFYRDAILALAADPGVSAVLAVQDAPSGLDEAGAAEYADIIAAVAETAPRTDKPVILLSQLSSGLHPALRTPLDAAGVPILHGTRTAMAAIRDWSTPPEPRPAVSALDEPPLPAWVERFEQGGDLTEQEALAFLADHGFTVPRQERAASAEAAAEAGRRIGFPVVLKVASPDLAHKSDVGGVRLRLGDEAAVRTAYDSIMADVSSAAPGARIAGVLVQETVTDGVEAMLGLSRQPPFGHALVVGSGGVLVELIADTALALAPVDPAEAERMIAGTRLARLLAGYRGGAARDVGALADAAVRLGRLAVRYRRWIEAVDLNPVAVRPKGVCVLDGFVQVTPVQK